MSVGIKADPSGTFGELLLGGSPVVRFDSGGLTTTTSGQDYYNQANILGAVSQSGGVPTGAIIERGSNANGEYVRYADGTQICKRTQADLTGAVNIAAQQAPFRSVPITLTFAAVFFAEPTVVAFSHNFNIDAIVVGTNASTGLVDFILGRKDSSGGLTQPVNYIAIGRWF